MKKLFIISFCLLLSLTLSACGKKTATEKSMEKQIENSMGGNADVDLDDDSVKIKTDEGTMQVGAGTELPEDWPDDIYIAEGAITSASSHENGIFNVSIESTKSVTELQEEYENKLEEEGWNTTMSFVIENNVMLGAEKDDRSVSITIGEDNGKTLIVIGTSKN
ncbi:hypothetical protein HOB10_04740 [Candidatus Parcubacteria bacterium]|jgi:hypothetical protein|nr:hypothetical protein [Candidatus Parcubacteria bacterium]